MVDVSRTTLEGSTIDLATHKLARLNVLQPRPFSKWNCLSLPPFLILTGSFYKVQNYRCGGNNSPSLRCKLVKRNRDSTGSPENLSSSLSVEGKCMHAASSEVKKGSSPGAPKTVSAFPFSTWPEGKLCTSFSDFLFPPQNTDIV